MGLGGRAIFLLLGLALLAGLIAFGIHIAPVIFTAQSGREVLNSYLVLAGWLLIIWFIGFIGLRDEEWKLRQDALGLWTVRVGRWLYIALTLLCVTRALMLGVRARDVALAIAAFALLALAVACIPLGRFRAKNRITELTFNSLQGIVSLCVHVLRLAVSLLTLVFGAWVVLESAKALYDKSFEYTYSLPQPANGWWLYYPMSFLVIGLLLVVLGYVNTLYGDRARVFLRHFWGSRRFAGSMILLAIPLLGVDFYLGGLSWGHVLFNPSHWIVFIAIGYVGISVYQRGLLDLTEFLSKDDE